MRRVVAAVAVSLAVVTAGAAIALAVAAGSGSGGEPAAAPSTEPIGDADYCFVEAMIYYRVEEGDLARSILAKDAVAAGVDAFASGLAERSAAELEDLRAWYVSWADARPIDPPTEGPCAGHGTDHAQMPGMPSWGRQLALAEAQPPEAEREFIGIVEEQNTGMIALVDLILAGDPHSEVAESAAAVRERAESDLASLDELLASLP